MIKMSAAAGSLNLLAPINQLGYGIVGLNLLDQLSQTHDVSLFPVGGLIDANAVPADKREMVEMAKVRAGFFDGSAPSLRVFHQWSLAEHVGRGLRVGFPFFELRQLAASEQHHMRSLDRLVVASRWAADVCEERSMPRPAVAPLGVDRSIFNEDVPHDRLDPDFTVFINVGKWEVRKGHDVLLRAFNAAFEPADKAVLKMLTMCPFSGSAGNEAWARRYLTSKMGVAGRIELVPRRLGTQRGVAAFMAAADAAVFPARAEAWNLDLLECMSCGLACVATDYAGHAEYVHRYNCRLIEVDEYETAADGVWFHGDGEWAKMGDRQVEQVVGAMREIHRAKQAGSLPRRNAAAIETAKAFSWRRTADVIREVVR